MSFAMGPVKAAAAALQVRAGLAAMVFVLAAGCAAGAQIPLEIANQGFEDWAPRHDLAPRWQLRDGLFPAEWLPETGDGPPGMARIAPAQDDGDERFGERALFLRGRVVSSPICAPLDSLVNRTVLVSVRSRGPGGNLHVGLRAYNYPPTENLLYAADLMDIETTAEWRTWSVVAFVSYGRGMRSVRLALDADGVFVDDVRVSVLERPEQQDALRLSVPIVASGATPEIDGRHTTREWAGAVSLTGFGDITSGALAARQGTVSLLSDGSRLLLCTRWPAQGLRAEAAERDGEVWRDDAVEVFVGAWPEAGQHPPLHQLVANSRGVLYDQRIDTASGEAEVGWDSAASVRSGVADGWWTLEMAVPLAEVGVAPDEQLGLQVCRDFAGPAGAASLTGGPYRQVFPCVLAEGVPSVAWSYTGSLAMGAIDLRLGIANRTDAPMSGVARIAVAGSAEQEVTRPYDLSPGATNSVVLELADIPIVFGDFTVEVRPDGADASFCQRFTLNTASFTSAAVPVLPPTRLEFYPLQGKINLRVTGVPEAERASCNEALFRVHRDGVLVADERVSPPVWAGDEANFVLPVELAAGAHYRAEALVCDARGRVLERVNGEHDARPAPWLGNTLGLDPVVIPPWTPLQVDGARISCWGREHSFAATGLPEQITALGRPLLARGVRLTVVDEAGRSRELAPTEDRMRVTSHADDEVTFESRAVFPDMSAHLSGTMCYDGMVEYALEVTPQAPVAVRGLSLEIPLAVAKDLHCVRDRMRVNSEWERLPEGQGVVWDSTQVPSERVLGSFVPFLWVGDERGGLAWCADNDRGWITDDASPCLQLVRAEDAVTLRVNFINRPITLAEPLRVTFGLQATPVKPTPVAPQHKFVINYFGFDNPIVGAYSQGMISREPDLARQILQPRREAGESAHVYMANQEMPSADPVARQMFWEWAHSGFGFSPGGLSQMRLFVYGPDPANYISFHNCATPARVDYNLDCFDRLLDLGISGLYLDNSYPFACSNLQHEHCGYLRADGSLQSGYNLMNTRSLVRRAAVRAWQSEGIWPRVSVHMTGAMVVPCFSFAELCIDGEDHSQMSMEPDFMDLWPLDRVAIMGAVAWGPMRGWLPKIHFAEGLAQERPTRTMLAALKLFDLWIWPANCNTRVLQRLLDIERECGFAGDDVRFLGYWENARYVSHASESVKASFYVRPGELALVYLSSFSRQDVEETVSFDLSEFGLEAPAVLDAETGEMLADRGEAVTLTIGWHDFRVLKLVP